MSCARMRLNYFVVEVLPRRGLATVTVESDEDGRRLERLRIATTREACKLPVAKRPHLRKRVVSIRTKQLYEDRVRRFHQLVPEERTRRGKEIGRACRDDYRRYIANQVGYIELANGMGNTREVARLTKVMAG